MPTQADKAGRPNQRHRTRKDLLAAAARLLKAGRTPDMDEVAREAMVSRATAYRYFPSIETLLIEAPLDGVIPSPEQLFGADDSTDPLARIDKAEAIMHEVTYRNAAQLRLMLAASLERASHGVAGNVPVRQNRRTPLIAAALAPARGKFKPTTYENLCASLAMIFGPESMVVFKDVLGMNERSARKVKSWAVRTLVAAALRESAGATRVGLNARRSSN